MADVLTTDLVSRLRVHCDRDQCVSYDWGEPKFDAGQDCADAIAELERLERERSEWAGIAAQRLRETQMARHERDCAMERAAELVKAIQGITCRLLPQESGMDMRFARCDVERLNALCSPSDVGVPPCALLHDFDPMTRICRHCGTEQPPL